MTNAVADTEIIDARPLPAIRAEMGLVRDPIAAIEDGRKAARAITSIIAAKPNPVVLGGKQYLELEDWVMLGEWYGVAVMVESDRRIVIPLDMVPDPNPGGILARFRPREPVAGHYARGWEATAIVIDKVTGATIGRANAMCLDDEDIWNTRPRYEWRDADDPEVIAEDIVDRGTFERRGAMIDRVKVHVADEPVPDFMRRSMAQTRASSKALSLRLRWIPMLGNLAGGTAEEVNTPAADIPPRGGVRSRVAAAERAAPARRPPSSVTGRASTAAATPPRPDPSTWLPPRDRKIIDAARIRAHTADMERAEAWLKANGFTTWGDFYMRGNSDQANLVGIVLGGGSVDAPPPAPGNDHPDALAAVDASIDDVAVDDPVASDQNIETPIDVDDADPARVDGGGK